MQKRREKAWEILSCRHASSQQPGHYETDLTFCLATKVGQVPAESYTEHMERTQAKSHDSKRLLSDKCENTQQ